MEVTALLFRLLMFEFILLGTQVEDSYTHSSDADFLRISPDRLQHFQLDSVSFDCGGFDAPTRLRGIRGSADFNLDCDRKTLTGTSCTIDRVYPEDSGVYWCETAGGKRSNSVNITVTAGSVILDIPVYPVMEGDNVTLSCRNGTSLTTLQADFFKDGRLKVKSAEEMTINSVSTSDEGLYMCNITGVGASPESWLSVRVTDKKRASEDFEAPDPNKETVSDESEVPPVSGLLWVAVIILMTALLLLVVGLILCIWKRRVSTKTQTAPPCSGENTQTGVDESSLQPVYSTLTISQPHRAVPPGSGSSSSTVNLSPAAATDPNETETDVIYSPVRTATKSRDA